ncbi:MAG: M48 family metalloprotease [Terriglobales bacterium]
MRIVNRVLATVLITLLGVSSVLAADSATASVRNSEAATTVKEAVDRLIQRERDLQQAMRRFHPMVETYFQTVNRDDDLGTVPVNDRYFVGRLDLSDATKESFYINVGPTGFRKLLGPVRRIYAIDFMPLGFSSMIFPDRGGFTRQSYYFQFVRREFLGDVRCLVFQVTPKDQKAHGRFLGRIWVEDKDYSIVRFNGTYTRPQHGGYYFHMDSWRTNVQPGLWVPSEIYTEESDLKYGVFGRRVSFKAQTRLWAYDLRHAGRQEEFTDIMVDSPASALKDRSDSTDWSPVTSLREWQREAEDNVLERLEKASLLAPTSEVDKVLETVVNNLVITNNLDIQPEVRCRVLLTSPLETFTVGHTIVVSRGLLDVLPDEASLAMVLSHELAHIAMGDLVDARYAFSDRMMFADEDTYSRFRFTRNEAQEQAADKRAIEFLKSSPYKDKLESAGLFLRQLDARAPYLANLNKPRLGNGLTGGGRVIRMTELMNSAPALQMRDIRQVAALPLGGRIKLDPWDDHVELKKTKPVPLQSIREKMPFEIAPVIPHLTRLNSADLAVNAGK